MKKQLRIVYDSPVRLEDLVQLEEALTQVLREYGYEFWASGYDLTTGKRDLAFELEALPCE